MEQNKCYLVISEKCRITYIARVSALTETDCVLDFFRHDGETVTFNVERIKLDNLEVITEISKDVFYMVLDNYYEMLNGLQENIKKDKPTEIRKEIGACHYYYDEYGYLRVEKVIGLEKDWMNIQELDFNDGEPLMSYCTYVNYYDQPVTQQCYYLEMEVFDKMWDMITSMGSTIDNIINAYLP